MISVNMRCARKKETYSVTEPSTMYNVYYPRCCFKTWSLIPILPNLLVSYRLNFVMPPTSKKLRGHCYAPNFEEVEGAYWFGPVRGSVRASVRASVTDVTE